MWMNRISAIALNAFFLWYYLKKFPWNRRGNFPQISWMYAAMFCADQQNLRESKNLVFNFGHNFDHPVFAPVTISLYSLFSFKHRN